jgi:hypothetical protein
VEARILFKFDHLVSPFKAKQKADENDWQKRLELLLLFFLKKINV